MKFRSTKTRIFLCLDCVWNLIFHCIWSMLHQWSTQILSREFGCRQLNSKQSVKSLVSMTNYSSFKQKWNSFKLQLLRFIKNENYQRATQETWPTFKSARRFSGQLQTSHQLKKSEWIWTSKQNKSTFCIALWFKKVLQHCIRMKSEYSDADNRKVKRA